MCIHLEVGRDSSVGIGAHYGLDSPEIESGGRGGRNFLIVPDRPSDPLTLLYNGYWFLGRGKPGVVLALKKEYINTSTHLCALMVGRRMDFTFTFTRLSIFCCCSILVY